MPIFDYKCTSCDNVDERLVKNADVEVVCKKCGEPAKKQVSAPGAFNLVGAGFYKNDSTINELKSMEAQSNALKKKYE